MEHSERSDWTDLAVAVGIAAALACVWTLRTWSDLVALRLPDADDMMRLQQVRDWLAGQKFADLTQYRLGFSGVPMHWSRIPDLGPAAIIWTMRDFVGQHAAEVAAVIVWPTILYALTLWLSSKIGLIAAGKQVGRLALIVSAFAYPATTVFVPGRIDHHGLQLLLLLITTLGLLQRPTILSGLAGGLATVLSLSVGLELAPILGAAALVAMGEWVLGFGESRRRLLGLGVALTFGTVGASVILHTFAWSYPACDGFTAISARATVIAGCLPLSLALLPQPQDRPARCVIASILSLTAAAAIFLRAPQCLSPFGQVPLALRTLWLAHVSEVQPLFKAAPNVVVAQCGLMMAGLVAGIVLCVSTGRRDWIVLTILQAVSVLISIFALRGAYAGAILSAPALAAMIVAARRRGNLTLAASWIASGGLFYPMAAEAFPAKTSIPSKGASCTAPDLIAALNELPAGRVMAPVGTAAPAIIMTQQRLLAGPYHRDAAGDLAMYSFFLHDDSNARRVARQWHVSWVVACDDFGGVAAPFADRLERGETPSWLRPVRTLRSGSRIYRVSSPE